MAKGKQKIRIQEGPTPTYPHEAYCHVCNRRFFARYNYEGRAKVCTPPDHKCRPSYKKLPNGRVKKTSCVDECCRSKYARGATGRVSDVSIDRRKFLNAQEFEAFIEETRKVKNPYGLALRFIAATGVRVGETGLLKSEHFHVKQKLSDVQVPTPKRIGCPVLPVDLNEPWIVKELREWIKEVERGKPVFLCPKRTLQKHFTRIVKKLRLSKDGGIHILRHTRAVRLILASDGDMNYVCKQMRWSSLEVGKIYIHTLGEQRKDIQSGLKALGEEGRQRKKKKKKS